MANTAIRPTRFWFASTMLLISCYVVAILVRTSTTEPYATLVAAVGGVLFTLIPASIYEWLVHRYVYHGRRAGPLAQIYRIHHIGHHAKIFPTWRYTTNGPVRRHPVTAADISTLYPSGPRNLISKLAHFGFYMLIGLFFIWIPAWFLTHSPVFLFSIIVTSAVISDLFVRVHDAIHYPGRFRFVEAQPWFPFIDRHHFIHHVDMSANVNFLLPLADWCFGTLRTELSDEEIAQHGTLERAKATPVGYSEPAAIFAAELRSHRISSAAPES